MKTHNFIPVVFAITAYAVASPVFAQRVQESGFYLGGAVGQAKAKDACNVAVPAGIFFSCDEKDTTWKVFAGYEFNKYLALEGAYVDLGEAKATATGPGGTATGALDGKGWELLGVGSIPFNDQFSAYGKAGIFRWKVDGSLAVTGIATTSVEETGTDFTYGVGLRYNFTRNLGARLEWQRYNNVGESDTTGQADVDLLSIGLIFRF